MFDETEEQRSRRIADIRAALAKADILSGEDRNALLGLDFLDFPRVITAHKGYRPDAKLESLVVARRLFVLACDAIIELLDAFHSFSDTDEFHRRSGEEVFDRLIDQIRKELFTVSTLAHSIQDHCRRVQKIWVAPEFDARIAASFGMDRLHDFVIQLRNALHHQRVFEAEWSLRWSNSGEKSSHISLDREDLLQEVDDWGRAGPWLDAAPEEIDVRTIVIEYRRRSDDFYGWYLGWCEAHLPAAVAEYRELRRQQKADISRSQWHFLVGELIKRGVDPIPHLPKYLKPAELAAAGALAPRSAELADFVIACLDRYGGCDEELRQMAYRLFDVPGAAWQPSPPVIVRGSEGLPNLDDTG